MAIKTFTTGEVLTASDTNTYLANSGLVYVTSATVGTAVSSVTVSSAFNSTYENYLVVYNGGVGSATHNLSFKLGSATTSYYGGGNYANAAGAAGAVGDSNTSTFRYAGGGDTYGSMMTATVLSPYLAKATYLNAVINTGSSFGTYTGRYFPTDSFTAFTIAPDSGTLTGGTITVYGFRKA
jgi:hypothetical protein